MCCSNNNDAFNNNTLKKGQNVIRQNRKRKRETIQERLLRLKRMKKNAQERRSIETLEQKNLRLDKCKKYQQQKRSIAKQSKYLTNTRKEVLWRHINQNISPTDNSTNKDLETLADYYEQDLQRFKSSTINPLYYQQCSICGLADQELLEQINKNNQIFSFLKSTAEESNIQRYVYGEDNYHYFYVCRKCLVTLRKKRNNVPKFSRVNIQLPDPIKELQDLTYIEQLLISPILPMVFVWRYKHFGQFQSKGQCVALRNELKTLTKVLPRTLNEVFINIKDIYGHKDFLIRLKKLREALLILKQNHPAFESIMISEKKFEDIEEQLRCISTDQEEFSDHILENPTPYSASEIVHDAGQNQTVEEDIAQVALTSPVTIETTSPRNNVREAIKELFKTLTNKNTRTLVNQSTLQGWPLMFPCLLWNGKGGPDLTKICKVSLREWVNYVIRVPSLDFQRNIIFLSYANSVMRRQRITGLTAHKPISNSVEEAVKEIISISRLEKPSKIPDSTLNALCKRVSAYVDELPGSLSDMRKFRNDILSMNRKHGAPTFFLTLSSADSIWPEGFVQAKNGKILIENVKELSPSDRAELMAENPVAMTISWKRRLKAFLDFIIKGYSKPLGEITHYVWKSEWQGRLSEHAHFLFWTKPKLPSLKVLTNGDLDGNQNNICSKAESFASSLIPTDSFKDQNINEYKSVENDSNYSASMNESRELIEQKLSPIKKEDIINSICQQPISLHDYFTKTKSRTSIKDLIRSVNIHMCSAYCTKNNSQTCKSKFPFKITNTTTIKKIIDKNLNKSYRIYLRRNHSRVNPYSLPIINFWRANMDLTVLCGDPFSSIVYVTYYTSKLDKASNIRDVLQKMKTTPVDDETETKKILRKLLINMDTCRITGLPEATSNLLLYPHRFTSSKILRIDTRLYLSKEEQNFEELPSKKLDSLLYYATKENDNFAIPDHDTISSGKSKHHKLDPIVENYFNRPEMLYDENQNKMINANHVSMTDYIEKYKITRKKNVTSKDQSKDLKGRVVELRQKTDQDVVLDLKFRISPPDRKNPKWCAGALALNVPHRSIADLLHINGELESLVNAYNYYYSYVKTDTSDESEAMYPVLHKFEQNESDLYTAINNTNHLPIHLQNKKSQEVPDLCSDMYTSSPSEEEDEMELDDPNLNLEDIFDSEEQQIAITKLKSENCKSWNGKPSLTYLTATNPWSIDKRNNKVSLTDEFEISNQHRSFMSLVVKGENPNSLTESVEVQQALLHTNGCRKLAASNFLENALHQCKNDEQKNAIEKVTDVLQAYYYGNYKSQKLKELTQTTPVITMIGVPGAGKSWVIRKIRSWVDIRCKSTDQPITSFEYDTLNTKRILDPVSQKVCKTIKDIPKGNYGKSVALAFTGCAAGIIKGFTIHHGCSFPVKIEKEIKSGELPLPDLKPSSRTKLLESWCSVKLLIIDEVYALKAEWLSLIDEKLRQIFNSNQPFAGIPVLLAGDPRQIVPVNGKPLFTLRKYFDVINGKFSLNKCGKSNLSPREEKGFLLYASSQFSIIFTESVRLANKQFADLNMKIAQYKLNSKDIEAINRLHLPLSILEREPWIDAPWMFPTWKEVNEHILFVSKRARKTKGIFRAWCPVSFESIKSEKQKTTTLQSFYTSSTFVSAHFTCPLPYIDFFVGQIVCLKRNWNPTWKLYNNAKAFVVGIQCQNEYRQNNPLMSMSDAIKCVLENPDNLRYTLLVKPLLPFLGPSALETYPGILEVPWVSVKRKINGCQLTVEGPCVFPANAFSHHQSQGSTFERSVSCINENCKAYGMANVVTSRTPDPNNFALATPVTRSLLLPSPRTSQMVEEEYKRLKLCHAQT